MAVELDFWQHRALAWAAAAAVALVGRAIGGWSWPKALGVALMSVPVWLTATGIAESIGPLLQGDTRPPALSRRRLSDQFIQKTLSDVGYLGAGALLWASSSSAPPRRRGLAGLPRFLASRGLAHPLGERASIALGLAITPATLLGAFLVSYLASGSPLQNNDESRIFDNMTPYHAVMISLAAGFGEELVYRGFLQTALRRSMPVGAAIAGQALFFGLAHAGYGNWLHVLQPTLFGAVAGLLAWRFGIWSAVVLHVLIDIYAFAPDAAQNVPWWDDAVAGLLLANLAFAVAWGLLALRRALQLRAAARP